MRRLWPVVLLLSAACGSPTGPHSPTLQFSGVIVFGIATLATRAVGEDSAIKVTGVLPTPTAEYTLFGKLKSIGGTHLILEITAYDNRPGARFPVQNYYEGRIEHLAPGDYDLQVLHSVPFGPIPTVRVFHETVTVH